MSELDKKPIPDAIREQAARWLARNEGDHPEAGAAAFREWLARDLRYRLAYAEAERAWRDSLSLAKTQAGRHRTLTRAPLHLRRSTHLMAASLAVVVCVGLVSFQVARNGPGVGIGTQAEARSFQTAAGETRTWSLDDGTTLTLIGASLARFRFDAGQRRIDLVQGYARIRVAGHDPRPLEVRAAGLSVHASEAAFEISAVPAANRIEVMSGQVEARMQGGAVQSLTAGQAITAPSTPTPAPTAKGDAPGQTSSTTTAMTIGEAVQQLNQRNGVQIHLADAAMASRRLAGGFRIDDPEGFAQAVAALGNLDVTRSRGDIVLRAK